MAGALLLASTAVQHRAGHPVGSARRMRMPTSVLVLRFVDVESPAAYASPEGSVLTRLFAKLLSDYLNELAYPADLAGVAL